MGQEDIIMTKKKGQTVEEIKNEILDNLHEIQSHSDKMNIKG